MFLLQEIKTLDTNKVSISLFSIEMSDLINYAQDSGEISVYSSYLHEECKDAIHWLYSIRKIHEKVLGIQDYSLKE